MCQNHIIMYTSTYPVSSGFMSKLVLNITVWLLSPHETFLKASFMLELVITGNDSKTSSLSEKYKAPVKIKITTNETRRNGIISLTKM